jgi:hypothetical protein
MRLIASDAFDREFSGLSFRTNSEALSSTSRVTRVAQSSMGNDFSKKHAYGFAQVLTSSSTTPSPCLRSLTTFFTKAPLGVILTKTLRDALHHFQLLYYHTFGVMYSFGEMMSGVQLLYRTCE